MGISLVLAAMMLKTGLLQTPFVHNLLPSAETSAGIWIRSVLDLPLFGALAIFLAGVVCGLLLTFPVLVYTAVSGHPFVIAFRKNWRAQRTPEQLFANRCFVFANRCFGLPFVAAGCVGLAISSFASGGWSWQVSDCILLGIMFLWVAIRPQHWGFPT